jgi:hypothetical protein
VPAAAHDKKAKPAAATKGIKVPDLTQQKPALLKK